jgi:GMP synthase-like glutamine amidotransferase
MRIHYFQHVPFEDPAYLLSWARRRSYQVTRTRLYTGETPPDSRDYDLLVIMGGPMGIYEHERYPWLSIEKNAIRQAIDTDRHVLGICLGGQLIADVLGAKVRVNDHKEIGWFPLTLTEEAGSLPFLRIEPDFMVFHWHGETFDLPDRAVRICSTEACRNQGFTYGRHVMGLQFHLEATVASVNGLIENARHEIVEAPYIHSVDKIRSDTARFQKTGNERMAMLLRDWLAD